MKDDELDEETTIADMSGLEDRGFHLPRRRGNTVPEGSENREGLTREQRLWVILGALKAAILLAAVYGVVYFIVIFLMTRVWH